MSEITAGELARLLGVPESTLREQVAQATGRDSGAGDPRLLVYHFSRRTETEREFRRMRAWRR